MGGLLGVLVMEQQYFIIQASLVSLLTTIWWVESQKNPCFGFNEQTGGFVGWEPHSEREHTHVYKSVCGVSYRLISTGQLHESLVLASTSGLSTQWSAGGLSHV